jgi:tripartite-type tricarboxylate transporter receptor subunit TctC
MERRQISAMIRIITIFCAVLFISGFVPNESWGAEKKFPVRTINVVVPYNPGSTDVYSRPHIEKLSEQLGQPITFLYKPGAAGTIGASFAAKSNPDGYTLLASSPGPTVLGPATKEDLDYTYDSFAPLFRLIVAPVFLAVKADSPLKTLDDVIAAAKASPGKLTYSHSGVLGHTHFAMEVFAKSAGIKLSHVPCAGSGPAVTALLGGHVMLSCSDFGPLKPQVDAGTLRLIALMDDKRLQSFPNVPTFLELGHRVIFPAWYGLFAPKGTPKEVIDTIYDSAKKAYDLNRDSLEKQYQKLGIAESFLNADEFDKANREHLKTIKEIFKDIQGK